MGWRLLVGCAGPIRHQLAGQLDVWHGTRVCSSRRVCVFRCAAFVAGTVVMTTPREALSNLIWSQRMQDDILAALAPFLMVWEPIEICTTKGQAAADLANAPTREELITTITSVPILNGNGWIGNYDERIADALIASGKVRVRA